MRLVALALALALVALAGCIQPPGDPGDLADRPIEGRDGGTMSADERRQDEAGLCTESVGLPLVGGDDDGQFCATRTITVAGSLAGFDALDAMVETFNGNVRIETGAEGKWGFVATLKARDDSEAGATSKIDAIDFSWAHEGDGGHFIEVAARHEGPAENVEAAIVLTTPPSLVLTLVAATSNGDVELAGAPTNNAALTTSNGDVIARGSVTQVSLTTSNGNVDAALTPTADTRWMLTTSNGDIMLQVPEGTEYGYRIEGTTSNGEVDYTLRDGEKGPCPQGSEYYTPPCNHRTWETRGFNGRDVRVNAMLTTSNGEVNAAPK